MTEIPRSFRLQNRTATDTRRRPSPAMKRFMARYIFYLEITGYALVSLVALAVIACFFFQVDDTITGDAVPIQARTESIKPGVEALVTRVFVQNHQSVRRGDPLVEVVERPRWVSRYLVMHQMQALLDEIDAPGQPSKTGNAATGPDASAASGALSDEDAGADSKADDEPPLLPPIALTPEEARLRAFLKQRLADWNAREVAKSPRLILRAPIDGVVVAPDDLLLKRVGADEEILKVADLNDLRLDVKFNNGGTIPDARVGQKALIDAISPEYKAGVTLRADTVPQGRHLWQRERITSSHLLGSKIKKIVKDYFKGRTITQRDDIPFKVDSLKNVEVDADLTSSLVPHSASPAPPMQADAPADLPLTGKVIDGKHHLDVQVADLPAAVRQQVAALVTKKLRGKTIAAPQPPTKEGATPREQRLRVTAVRNVQIIAQVKGVNDSAKGPTDRLKRKAARTSLRGAPWEKMSDARQFEATVRITNPPQFLKDQVLDLMDQGKDVKAKAKLITGHRAVAFLLLKR